MKSQGSCEFAGYKRKKQNKEVTPIEQRNDQGSKHRKAGYRSDERKRTEYFLCNAFKSNIFSFQTAASGSIRSKEVAMPLYKQKNPVEGVYCLYWRSRRESNPRPSA